MLRQRTRLLLLPLLAVLAVPAAAKAQESAINGTFTLNRQASDDVNRAIETAVARMNFVTRPIARGRLRKTNVPYNRMVIAHTAQEVSTTFDNRRAIVSPSNGREIEWTREDGERLHLRTAWENGKLVQVFRADDGTRTNTYSVSGDGRTLTMHVQITSPRLPRPLEYNLVYNRAS